ncbi:energy-coupling factor transporter transmembrane component T family protein [Streptococcus sp. DD13]|uniref:energy-coupling factor transporter transmembrane component T family protein n=1 Tax=Streptococcus sp. DD13 TaxID=1777881 RepID=UPI0007922A11|nr:energy-coupling factor transporter transmembrane component T [Streptococcus sp. DD13]KXT77757.1 Transmembrane component of general energizing module of ECF transporter [Streptococcus sp. DD13]
MDRLILGRYIPGNSIIHRLDPRSKLLAVVLFLLIVFFANNLLTNLLLIGFVWFLITITGIKLSFFIKGLKPMIGIILFTTLFQVFFVAGEHVVWQFWVLRITTESLRMGAIIFCRFILIVFFSTLLTLTTTPLALADGVEASLKPLARFKVPVHEIGLMLSMSLRFVPTLMDDTQRIMNAQRARGVDFSEGSIVKRIRAVIPILIPLFASSFKRAEALATAIEARGYQGGDGRTKYRVLKWKRRDTFSIVIMVALGLLLYLLKN